MNSTKGKMITYDGKPINAFFHSNSGGTTEVPIKLQSEDGTVEQWITVDLKNMYDLSMVYISWEGAYAKSYQIQTSLDGTDFTDIYVNTNAKGGKQTIDKTSFINPALAKYVADCILSYYKKKRRETR